MEFVKECSIVIILDRLEKGKGKENKSLVIDRVTNIKQQLTSITYSSRQERVEDL